MTYILVRVTDKADWRAYHDIRCSVLWEERGRSDYDETRPEELLPHYHPLLLKVNGRESGTARPDDLRDGTGIVRLVAISAAIRGQGHGRVLNMMIEEYASRLGIRSLFVNAAANAVGFYTATGWDRLEGYRPRRLEHSDQSVPMRKVILL